MIQELSSAVAKWMEQEGAISGEDKDLFSYALYSLLFGLLPLLIVAMLGIAFGMLREGLLLSVPFMLIRKFSGGYHLNSPRLCVICSAVLLALAMKFIQVIVWGNYKELLTILVILSTICICTFSPVDNSFRKLTIKEKKTFRKIACVLSIISLIGYVIMCEKIPNQYAVAFGVGIILVAMLQIVAVLVQVRELNK